MNVCLNSYYYSKYYIKKKQISIRQQRIIIQHLTIIINVYQIKRFKNKLLRIW